MFTNPLELAVVSGLIVALGTIIWWWFQRVVKALDHSAKQQQDLAISITKICGTMTTIAQWQELHEKTDSDRHESSREAIDQLRETLRSEKTRTTLEVLAGAGRGSEGRNEGKGSHHG